MDDTLAAAVPGQRGAHRRDLLDRVAGAPISWGVCEVSGWGHQLDPARVLAEMRELGLVATEFGPDGFLPHDPTERAELLRTYGLRAVGGFVPVVLHDPGSDPLPGVDTALDAFVAAGARTLVLAAATGQHGYDARPQLGSEGWATLLGNLDRIATYAEERGVRATLHPHVGTMIETGDEVARVLDGSVIPLCLDTGHLLIGGTDPARLAADASTRIAHAHLKDVDAGWARRVQAGEAGYTDAVRAGMYRPLGTGDVDIAGVVDALESAGYDGWYVLEQDTVLPTAPTTEGQTTEGPAADVRASLDFLRGLAQRSAR
ncbi:MAG: sugar phosphate isomerase/epimerase [Actinomycetota bacterium]|nr:sugar phosphate isomerase/epimerase [Actinomycetota bacterium]